jgi:VWFA-related protein
LPLGWNRQAVVGLLTEIEMRYLCAAALALILAAQEPQFDVQSRLVLVPVTVTDGKGRAVDGLGAADFVLLDNGRRQSTTVDTFATGVAPIALVVAVQSSGISESVLAKVQKIGGMIQPLVTGERGCGALVAFDERVQWYQECTNDGDALSQAFRRLHSGPDKQGRMLDAAADAIDRLKGRRNVRRVLLLISESRDRNSETDLESVIRAAQAANVTIYAASYSAFKSAFTAQPSEDKTPVSQPPPRPDHQNVPSPASVPANAGPGQIDILGTVREIGRKTKPNTTQELTRATGGATYAFSRQRALEEAIEKVGAELHTQYLLSFSPDDERPGLHSLEIHVPGRDDVRVRARSAYWRAGPAIQEDR